jgi:hypothetical protein
MNIKALLLSAAAVFCLTTAAQAQIFTDTTGFTNWYTGNSTSGTLTKGVNTLDWSPAASANGGTNQAIGRSFTETTLADGQTMTFSFDWTQDTTSSGIIRVGLYDRSAAAIGADGWNNPTGGTFSGYYTFVRDNGGGNNTAREETGIFATGTGTLIGGTDLATNATVYDLGTATYNVTFSLTRTGTSIASSFLIMEGATERFNVSGTDTSGIYTVFDTAAIRIAGGTGTLDNLSLTLSPVPEPSTYALLGMGLVGVVVAARRRRLA